MIIAVRGLLILLLIGLCCGELLGPDGSRKAKESKQNEQDEEEDTLNSNAQVGPEDMQDINKVVNDQMLGLNLREYLDAVKEYKKLANELENNKKDDASAKLLDNIKDLTEKMMGQMDQAWLDTVMNVQNDAENSALSITHEENPQELLDQLPPLPDEEEEELTPDMKEGKNLYDDAMMKLKRRTPEIQSVIDQIKLAALKGYAPAKIKLAWSFVYGEGVEMNVTKAKVIFEELAAEGVADAHAGMGFLYANGLGVPVSQGKSLVHYQMGALGDSWYAQMALGYRYWSGNVIASSCPKALQLYSQLATKVAAGVSWTGGPVIHRIRLTDEADSGTLDADLIEYYQLLAEKGDVQAQVGLGQLHFQGGRGVTLDIGKSLHYFQQAASAGNPIAYAFLGKIYLEGGDGVVADNDTALRYFRKAAEMNNPVGQSGLGLMYLQGRGVQKDTTTAFKYFTMSANQGWVEGQLHLGFMYFGGIGIRRDFKQANKFFSLASQSGHILAFYHLGLMHSEGLGVLRSCTTALDLFKNVCERGEWGMRMMSAYTAFRAKNYDSALMQYMSLADIGYEVAQTNVAYLLDTGVVSLWAPREQQARALGWWARAAGQGVAAARVRLGDYHYYGLGTPMDLEAAAHHYRIASEQQHNAQAMFNLGYMHERGLGLARDLHLAKRCYDLAADASPDARLPAALALARLNTAVALSDLKNSPLAVIFLTGESALLSNWDLYLMTALLGALVLVIYMRRPPPPVLQGNR